YLDAGARSGPGNRPAERRDGVLSERRPHEGEAAQAGRRAGLVAWIRAPVAAVVLLRRRGPVGRPGVRTHADRPGPAAGSCGLDPDAGGLQEAHGPGRGGAVPVAHRVAASRRPPSAWLRVLPGGLGGHAGAPAGPLALLGCGVGGRALGSGHHPSLGPSWVAPVPGQALRSGREALPALERP